LVHKQSGQLLSSSIKGIIEADLQGTTLKAGAYAGVHEGQAPHALAVLYGTSKMVPRDFLSPSLENVKQQAADYLTKNLRDAVVTFKPIQQ